MGINCQIELIESTNIRVLVVQWGSKIVGLFERSQNNSGINCYRSNRYRLQSHVASTYQNPN